MISAPSALTNWNECECNTACMQVMHQRNKYLRNLQQGEVVGSFKLDIKTVHDAVGTNTRFPTLE